jgi:hypothetical protein
MYDVKLVGTKLMRPVEGFFKVYYFQNEARDKYWTPDDMHKVDEALETSPFTQEGMGVVTAFATRENGITKIFYFHPNMGFLNMGPLCFRNTDFEEPDMEYPMKDGLLLPGTEIVVPEMTCWGEIEALAFEQRMLSEYGKKEYRTRMNTTFFRMPKCGIGRLKHNDGDSSCL